MSKNLRREEFESRFNFNRALIAAFVDFGILKPHRSGRAYFYGEEDVAAAESAIAVLRELGGSSTGPEGYVPERVRAYTDKINAVAGFEMVSPIDALNRIVALFLDPDGSPTDLLQPKAEDNVVPLVSDGLAQEQVSA